MRLHRQVVPNSECMAATSCCALLVQEGPADRQNGGHEDIQGVQRGWEGCATSRKVWGSGKGPNL